MDLSLRRGTAAGLRRKWPGPRRVQKLHLYQCAMNAAELDRVLLTRLAVIVLEDAAKPPLASNRTVGMMRFDMFRRRRSGPAHPHRRVAADPRTWSLSVVIVSELADQMIQMPWTGWAVRVPSTAQSCATGSVRQVAHIAKELLPRKDLKICSPAVVGRSRRPERRRRSGGRGSAPGGTSTIHRDRGSMRMQG